MRWELTSWAREGDEGVVETRGWPSWTKLTSSFPGDGGASCGYPEGSWEPSRPGKAVGPISRNMLADKA